MLTERTVPGIGATTFVPSPIATGAGAAAGAAGAATTGAATGATGAAATTVAADGTTDVTNYASASVNVPASAVTSGTFTYTGNESNWTQDVTTKKWIPISVERPAPILY